ncbi:MAG TPA: hypothetical protein VH640_29165 [Bryobacteraceae bacterium]|jgi:hypothetical protein
MAQDITGTWQGKLAVSQAPTEKCFKIAKADGGGLKAMVYSIDQPGPGFAASAVTVQGSSVKITVPGNPKPPPPPKMMPAGRQSGI